MDIETIKQWHRDNYAEMKRLEVADDSTAGWWTEKNTGSKAQDLVILEMLEKQLVERGFSPLVFRGFLVMTSYGPIECRAFTEHNGFDSCTVTLVTAVGAGGDDYREVAVYRIVFREPNKKDGAMVPLPSPRIDETQFDVAGLVLPDNK